MPELRVMLVDDHAVLRAGLRLLIDGQSDMTVTAEAGGMREALRLAGQSAADVIVMDLSLPDGDGVTATEQLVRQHPRLRIIGLTRHEEPGYLKRMLAAGARGYVLKQSVADGLLTAIRAVAAGETYIDPSFTRERRASPAEHGHAPARDAEPAPGATVRDLTAGELAVLQQIAWSHTNGEIAHLLGMSAADVAEHKACAMRKLGLRTRIAVLRYAEAQGWKREE